ncbi:DUF6882 domain-containing protein [Corynebacterium sp. H128]|uniref:DUF6882 domain-containing protein n=1 Tax=Corynebacterium sp. H128 TaxID=3133427 RepID=UPI0030A01574
MIPEIRRVGQRSTLAAQAKQEAFGDFLVAHLGENYTWAYDAGTLRFESDRGVIQCDTFPVASVAVEPATLLWRWQPLGDDPGFNPTAAHGFRSFGEEHGLSSFTTEQVPYDVGAEQVSTIVRVCHDVIAAGYEIFGLGATFYSAPFNKAGSRLVLALENFRDANGPLTVPVPELNDVLPKLARLVAEVDDEEWSLAGLVQHFPIEDCVIERFIPERRTVATFQRREGGELVVTVERDQHGFVSYTRVTG